MIGGLWLGDLLKIVDILANGYSTWPMRDAVFLLLLAFNAWFIWKIGTNHLKHIDDRLDSLSKDIRGARDEVREVRDRVSHIEGQLEK